MVKRTLPSAWWSRCLLTVATYIVAADFLPTLLLVVINSVGYLPYSDRPGPGWQSPHVPTMGELKFFVGYAALLFPATALYGSFFALGSAIFGFCRLPRWAVRMIAAVGVLLRIQIPGQPDAADHQFTRLADADGRAVLVDDGQIPARQRQPDADRSDAVEFGGARDHRGLGRPVGVPHLAADRSGPAARRSARSGGQASPPKISSRTASSASAGHSAASVGTVDTTVMSFDTSHGPRSMPLRTSERGAGTRQAPFRHASHISSQDASNATDNPASTRSPGPIGLSCKKHLRFGVDERGGVAMCHRDALGSPGRPRGEDDPRVVAAQR